MPSDSTLDKVAVVTGASSGIGAATARTLGADGYRVALLARRLDRITTVADELGNGSIAIEADVTDRGSIVAAADRVRQELGTADVLVNNAGVMLLGPFESGQRASAPPGHQRDPAAASWATVTRRSLSTARAAAAWLREQQAADKVRSRSGNDDGA
jgi:NAD(P)-dependent dehydrogenase (short-subunit alcohol dehydrogenase family)